MDIRFQAPCNVNTANFLIRIMLGNLEVVENRAILLKIFRIEKIYEFA